MCGVATAQRLGLDRTWAELTGQSVGEVGIKLGWDLSDDEPFARTHAVLLGPTRSVVVLTAVPRTSALLDEHVTSERVTAAREPACLTAVPITTDFRSRWNALLASKGPTAVLALHDALSGRVLRDALRSCA